MGCNLRDLASPVPIQMTDLAGQRIAVDAFLTAYQFITSLRARGDGKDGTYLRDSHGLSLIHISEPTRPERIGVARVWV